MPQGVNFYGALYNLINPITIAIFAPAMAFLQKLYGYIKSGEKL
jgi:hypothetical protein